MDITNMLDSGVDGDWAQLNRDGFTIGEIGNGGGVMNEDVGLEFERLNWDGAAWYDI